MPLATDAEVIEKILWMPHYCRFGSQQIRVVLKRHHELTISQSAATRAPYLRFANFWQKCGQ